MARERKTIDRRISQHAFRHNLIDVYEQHGVWPNGRRIERDEVNNLHLALGSAHTRDDLPAAIEAAAKHGIGKRAVEDEWYRTERVRRW